MEQTSSLDVSIATNLAQAVSSHCNCPFNSSRFHSGEFSCLPTTCSSDGTCGVTSSYVGTVLYRAVVNGSSDLMTASQALQYVEEWREDTGSLLHSKLRLKLFKENECALNIESFFDDDC